MLKCDSNSRMVETTKFLLERGLSATRALSSLYIQETQGDRVLPSQSRNHDRSLGFRELAEFLLKDEKIDITDIDRTYNIIFSRDLEYDLNRLPNRLNLIKFLI